MDNQVDINFNLDPNLVMNLSKLEQASLLPRKQLQM